MDTVEFKTLLQFSGLALSRNIVRSGATIFFLKKRQCIQAVSSFRRVACFSAFYQNKCKRSFRPNHFYGSAAFFLDYH